MTLDGWCGMQLEELFKVVVQLREGGASDGEIVPGDQRVDREELATQSAELLKRGVEYAFWMVGGGGFAVGISSVIGLTAGDGTRPINVLHLIAVMMMLPLLGLLTTFFFVAVSGKHRSLTGPLGDLVSLCVRWGIRLSSKALETREKATQLKVQAALGVFRGDYEIMRPVLPWIQRRLTQTFSLWLSIGFVAAMLIRITGIDLSFGWQSTGDFLEGVLPKITTALSAPFGWVSPDFVPSEALIHTSRFSRFTGDYRGGADAAHLSWEWIPFLVAGAVFWGIVPRFFTLLWFRYQQGKAVAAAVKEWEKVVEIQRRLDADDIVIVRPPDETGVTAPEALANEARRRAESGHTASPLAAKRQSENAATSAGAVLAWQHEPALPEEVLGALQTRLNFEPKLFARYGINAADDRQTLEKLRAQNVELIVLVVEPFSPPGAGFVRQIKELRDAVGRQTYIVVELAWFEHGVRQPVPTRQLEIWTQSLQKLGDRAMRWHIGTDDASQTTSAALVDEDETTTESSPTAEPNAQTPSRGAL